MVQDSAEYETVSAAVQGPATDDAGLPELSVAEKFTHG